MVQLRMATQSDASIISLLGRTTFKEAFWHLFRDKMDVLRYLDTTFSVRKISSSLQKNNNLFYLATWNDLPVGYAKLKLNSHSEFLANHATCQLQKIYVLEDFQSKKIGRLLLEEVVKAGVERNYTAIWLSVYKGNTKAIHFYEKNDFQKIGDHYYQIGKENFEFLAMAKEF